MPWLGTLEFIHIAPAASYEMEELKEALLVAGRGIEGDRYFKGIGTYSPKPGAREVTLIEIEALDALARNDPPLQEKPIVLAPNDHRRNLTTRGVPLNHLVGKRFRVGETVLMEAALTSLANISKNSWDFRCICRFTTGLASIAGSRRVGSSARAIRSGR